ncbi:MDR family MFS transporter [Amycolatopsis sp. NPDC059021]|uniref:MDR family MFS transporter n=1 Tax=Amycolatopsis sp. NPDC059021 TaxID=3346704 RepID=UPI003671154B
MVVTAEEIPAMTPRLWRICWVIVFGAFAGMLDTTVVNVGVDTLVRDLGTGLGAVQWVFTAYLIALAVSLPVCGWLSRRFGAGRLWLLSLVAFTVASGLCALAGNIGWLIALRVVQGLAAGLMLPAGQTVLGEVAGPARLGRVMATLGIVVSLGPAIGPLTGGLILHSLSWPWLFLINLPIGVAGILLGLRYVPRGERGTAHRPDGVGYLLVGTGIPAVIYAATAWGETGTLTAPRVSVPALAGIALLVAFCVRTRRREHPLLDLGLFRNRTFAVAAATTFFAGPAMFGGMFLLPLYFQLLGGSDVVTTGLLMIGLGAGSAIALPFAGRLTDRYGGGLVALWGSVATLAVTVPFAVADLPADGVFVQVLLVLRGMASAFLMMPVGTVAYAAVTRAQLPDVTAQINIVMRVGGAVGTALFAVVLAKALPYGPATAFRTAFAWLTGCSVAAVALTAWLWRVRRAG